MLWTVNAMPWQQWRIESDPEGLSTIRSQHSGYVLTTDDPPGDYSWVWLSPDQGRRTQRWRVQPTPDRTAFTIEAASSSFALDSTLYPEVPASVEERWVESPSAPIMYNTHREAQQQWVIARPPFSDSGPDRR